jgi:L-amino acid N-acyltransferase YncA
LQMMTGHVYKSFVAKDGRKVILRCLRFEDLDGLLELINGLVKEGANILLDETQTRDAEAEWLARQLVMQEKGQRVFVLAESDGKIIANSHVERFPFRSEAHKGSLGIAIGSGYRDVGIGTEIMKTLIDESRKRGLKMLLLCVFENNKRARHVYEKVGFHEIGREPKGIQRNGKYIDEIRMVLFLEPI